MFGLTPAMVRSHQRLRAFLIWESRQMTKPPPLDVYTGPPKMMDEIEELWSLADECRQWAKQALTLKSLAEDDVVFDEYDRLAAGNEFKRLAKQLDAIAGRLAARLPT